MFLARLLQSTRHSKKKPVIYVLCPVCGADSKKRLFQNPPITVVRCLRCTAIYLNPRFENSQGHYFDSGIDYLKKKYAATLENVKNHPRYANYQGIVASLHTLKSSGRFLDVGAHIGNVLCLARELNYEVYGVEPSKNMTHIARECRKLEVFHGFLEEAHYPDQFFDVITLIDVFEHIEEPKQMLRELYRILKPSGVLFLRIPNGSYETLKTALLFPFFGYHCFNFFDTHEHLVHYTQKTLKYQLESEGFSEIKSIVSPPNLDSSGTFGKIVSKILYRLSEMSYKINGHINHLSSGVSGYYQRK